MCLLNQIENQQRVAFKQYYTHFPLCWDTRGTQVDSRSATKYQATLTHIVTATIHN